MKAIDLYSGVGGWSLGLKMAGVDVIQSYEWWSPAAETLINNLGGDVSIADIRTLPLSSIPLDIDIIVGSPPCTQFSYSNRGGSGDIYEGLKDIYKFLEIVEHVNPKYWVMENVPRVATILRNELEVGGLLERFRSLVDVIEVVDCSSFGIPQKRKRMLAGRFPFHILTSYSQISENLTLSQIMESLSGEVVEDLIYKKSWNSDQVTDHQEESPLTSEEMRMNRDAKEYHSIYNKMPFPEPLNAPARTITATETRVSRESLIVLDSNKSYRRLTNRERASIQSFPMTYQFCSKSHSVRQKLIGNAVPPLLTYYIARSMQEVLPEDMPPIEYTHTLPEELPTYRSLDNSPKKYPANRRFRAAIPNLRFGSGVRFDLFNKFENDLIDWQVSFSFGPSKGYSVIEPNEEFLRSAREVLQDEGLYLYIIKILESMSNYINKDSIQSVQGIWNHTSNSGINPYDLIDNLGLTVLDIKNVLETQPLFEASDFVRQFIDDQNISNIKLNNIALDICSGLFVASWFNSKSF